MFWKKRLFGELLLTFKNEILNTNENSLVDKKVTCEKNNWFIHTILLTRMRFLLLVVICFTCYHYYTRHWIKKNTHSYQYKMNNVKWSNVKNRAYYVFDDMINIKGIYLNKSR